MLDANDLRLIGEEMGRVIDDNLMPRIEDLINEKFEANLAPIKATMVTKDYLDEKLAVLRGDLIGYDRKLEKKTDVLVGALVERRALTASDAERLEQARVFPRTAP
jgi:hypothetical protein